MVEQLAPLGRGSAAKALSSSATAGALGCCARPLFVAQDETCAWVWLPFGSRSELSWDLLASAIEDGDPTARAAAGGNIEPM
ncbi:hypothetical protein [Saccharopolyspora sp. NPDC050642]|uniref:hypothetical protein n=1 Tax=Saccharopolyspora sp. NPDC050642 TaxID=3157099 RepID=UPI0033D320ED